MLNSGGNFDLVTILAYSFSPANVFFLTLEVKTVVAACSSDPSLLFLILSNTVSNFLTDLVFPGFQKQREWQAMWPPQEKH